MTPSSRKQGLRYHSQLLRCDEAFKILSVRDLEWNDGTDGEVRMKVTKSLNKSGVACPRGENCRKRGSSITGLRWPFQNPVRYLHSFSASIFVNILVADSGLIFLDAAESCGLVTSVETAQRNSGL